MLHTILRGLLAWTLAGLATWASAAELPALDIFFKRPDLVHAQLSPSGRWVLMTIGLPSGRLGLAVYDTSGATPPNVVVNFSDIDVFEAEWVNDEVIVFNVLDQERGTGHPAYAPGLFSVERDGKGMRQLVRLRFDFVRESARVSDRLLSPNHRLLHVPGGGGDEVIVGEYRYSNDWSELVDVLPKRLNVRTGVAVSAGLGTPPGTVGWAFDAQGRARAAVSYPEGRMRVFWHRDPASEQRDSWVQLVDHERFNAAWEPHSVDGEGRLWVRAPEGKAGEMVLKRFDFAAGKPETDPLASTPGFDFTGRFVTESRGGPVLGLRIVVDGETTSWMAPQLKALQEEVDRRLPGRANRISCRPCSLPGLTAIIESYSDREPGQFWLWQGAAAEPRAFRQLGRERPRVDASRMAMLDFQRFNARDGRSIPVWVTTPDKSAPAPAAGRRPAVVLAHGGPWVRGVTWGWHAMPQFLASRGYVVIEPEFRGSTGFGLRHFRAGFKQWGQAMQDDLADAVAWAAGKGMIDPARVCIMGASYGGYATLMGLVRHPGVYRCGVSWVGVSDPMLLLEGGYDTDVSDEVRAIDLRLMLGDPKVDADMLRDVSPILQAGRIKAPLLLAYGDEDRRVPLEHGKRIRAALRAAGQEPEYVVYEREGHGFGRTETRVDFARRVERFLEQHLK